MVQPIGIAWPHRGSGKSCTRPQATGSLIEYLIQAALLEEGIPFGKNSVIKV
jgi:hypothetical protein